MSGAAEYFFGTAQPSFGVRATFWQGLGISIVFASATLKIDNLSFVSSCQWTLQCVDPKTSGGSLRFCCLVAQYSRRRAHLLCTAFRTEIVLALERCKSLIVSFDKTGLRNARVRVARVFDPMPRIRAAARHKYDNFKNGLGVDAFANVLRMPDSSLVIGQK